ncbi:NIL domain-containing protein [Acetivibrio cellulolyticus]|uniref:NIL domain-containing protein n=1 Tax=Acetivibrio cellulolyticus TaxID=35830 RepID=UPI0001E2E746|nr:NIL domain-containing protein [Acetivibrio cellulolyticus]
MKKIKVSLFYPASEVTKPITYHLIKDFDLQVNILHADISLNKVGKLVIDIIGEDCNIENGLKYIEEQGIQYKLFTKSIIWQENDCVHCGACTAVCPSGALQMDRLNWELTFDKEKCMVCELCVKACPLKVMCVSI